MQETVTNPSERRSLLSSFLEVLEARERKAQADRQLQEEKYLRRTQRIYDYHDRQRRMATEVRRYLELLSSHAHVLESMLRGAGTGAGDTAASADVPLGAGLVRQAAALQRSMTQCIANTARIRTLLHADRHPQIDSLLAKMEAELGAWTAFLHRAADAAYNTEIVADNLHNMIAEQRRCLYEVSASRVFTALCGPDGRAAAGAGPGADSSPGADSPPPAAGESGPGAESPRTPLHHAATVACSTPIARD